jgi:hypothetical protein
MSILQGIAAAEPDVGAQLVAQSNVRTIRLSAGFAWLLDWIVDATDSAQRHQARVAQAHARAGGRLFDHADRFVSDAAGGGSRAAEAARALRAQRIRR